MFWKDYRLRSITPCEPLSLVLASRTGKIKNKIRYFSPAQKFIDTRGRNL